MKLLALSETKDEKRKMVSEAFADKGMVEKIFFLNKTNKVTLSLKSLSGKAIERCINDPNMFAFSDQYEDCDVCCDNLAGEMGNGIHEDE